MKIKRFLLCLGLLGLLAAGCADDSNIGEGPPCSENPCQNGGTCVAIDGFESCECPAGYTGLLCDLATALPCDPDPCLNGGVCTELPGSSYECACPADYSGTNCEVAPGGDPCEPNPCQNAGTCTVGSDGEPSCLCAVGYEGEFCEAQIEESPCNPNPCQNGGTCVPQQGDGYSCICAPGYQGDNCESMGQDPCDPNPCLNGGVCGDDGSGGFVCTCADGFEGELCESQLNGPCAPNPCQNGGTCIPNGDAANCICPAGFEGEFCESAVGDDPCSPNPCQNGGSCSDVNGNAECSCLGGYTGAYCDIPPEGDACIPNPCENGGTCVEDVFGNVSCECVNGYIGPFCEELPGGDPCQPNPCANGGLCAPSGGFACQAPDACNEPACVAAVCALDEFCCDDWDSNCADCAAGEPGFLGMDCSAVGDACVSDDAVSCTCAEGFSGPNCETIDGPDPEVCDPNPCLNGGSCGTDAFGNVVCSCVNGYTGDTCEMPPVDPCEGIVCENGGQCEQQAGIGVCVCAPGYEGPNCESEIASCDPNPCLNGGSCSIGLNGPICTCSGGYFGSLCEFAPAVDPCAPNPCLNGGECMDASDQLCQGDTCDSLACKEAVCALDAFCCNIWDGSCADCAAGLPGAGGVDCSSAIGACSESAYVCACPDGTSGPNCEVVDDPCTPNPCQNGGFCFPTAIGFQCECLEGYSGQFCETQVNGNDCDPNPCQNGGSCTPGGGGGTLCQGATCDDPGCLAAVCALDSYCCTGWDSFCVACAAGGPGINGLDCSSALFACSGGGGDGPLCSCLPGFEGTYCEIPSGNGGVCDPSPCLFGETCIEGQGPLCQQETCDDLACKSAVAQLDPFCADGWDSFCAQCAAGGQTISGDDCSGLVGICTGQMAVCIPNF